MSHKWVKLSELLPQNRAIVMIEAWKECAGPAVLENVRFQGIHFNQGKRCLFLAVKDPVWRQELYYQKSIILERFNALLSKAGWPNHELPTDCLFRLDSTVPLKSTNS